MAVRNLLYVFYFTSYFGKLEVTYIYLIFRLLTLCHLKSSVIKKYSHTLCTIAFANKYAGALSFTMFLMSVVHMIV